jgi:TRAP-type C4-dicarboxylate transport system substrate-binding protein
MKRLMIIGLFTLVLIFQFSMGGYCAENKVYNLKLVSYLSRAEMWMLDHFTKNWERMSNNRLKIQVFTGGELVPSTEIMNAVASGVADLGMSVGAYVKEQVPVAGAEAGLPFAWVTPWVDVNAVFYDKGLIDIVRDEYAKKGKVHYIGPACLDPYALLTKKEIKSLADLKKLKIRAAGDTAKMLNSIGVSTVYLPLEEIYLALATGTIDGVIFADSAAYYDLKFFEVAKYLIQPPLNMTINANLFANQRVWKQLPDDLKAIIEIGFKEFSSVSTYKFISDGAKKLEMAREKWGVKVVHLPEADVEELRKASLGIWKEYAKKSESTAAAVDKIMEWHKEAGYMK